LLCLLLAVAAFASKQLITVDLPDRDTFELVQRLIPDKEEWESLTETDLTAFASHQEVKDLIAAGLRVQQDVPNLSMINALESERMEKMYNRTAGSEPDWTQFCNYDCMVLLLNELTASCRDIFSLETIGTTVRGRSILVLRASLRLTDNAPVVLLAGNIHGDETTGGQLLQHLAWDFCDKYRTDPRINSILSGFVVYFMPMFNPDGYMNRNRANANNRDLNRDFPNTWTSPNDTPASRQPETQAYMAWTRTKAPVLSLMMHGGALVANYPYDARQPGTSGYSATDRDALVVQISRAYSFAHNSMWRSTQFRDGIVNGAVWYIIYGSAQDFAYDYRRTIDITIEVSAVKWPAGSTLPGHYNDNYAALLAFIESARSVSNEGGM